MFLFSNPHSKVGSVKGSGSYLSGLFRRITFIDAICCLLILGTILLLCNSQGTKDQNSEGAPATSETPTNEPGAQTRKKVGEETRSESTSVEFERLSRLHVRTQQRISGHAMSMVGVEVEGGNLSGDNAAQIASDGYTEGLPGSNEDGPHRGADLPKLIAALDNTETYKRVQAVRKLWIIAADMGVPEEALEALDYLILYDSDHEVVKEAALAAEDLRSLNQQVDSKIPDSNSEVAPKEGRGTFQLGYEAEIYPSDGKNEAHEDVSELTAQPQVEVLAEQALWSPYEVERRDAIHRLSLHRSEAAVDVLVQAAMDEDSCNRYKALQALWFMAADGLDKGGEIWLCLQQTLGDSDDQVAELASKALADLDRLEAQRSETETEMPSADDHTLDLLMYNEDGR